MAYGTCRPYWPMVLAVLDLSFALKHKYRYRFLLCFFAFLFPDFPNHTLNLWLISSTPFDNFVFPWRVSCGPCGVRLSQREHCAPSTQDLSHSFSVVPVQCLKSLSSQSSQELSWRLVLQLRLPFTTQVHCLLIPTIHLLLASLLNLFWCPSIHTCLNFDCHQSSVRLRWQCYTLSQF